MPLDKLVDSAMRKYGVPEWVRPYALRYIKDNPISSVKFAISLVDIKRKKGEVTKTEVRLPNGKVFRIGSIIKVLNLFFYGEDSIAHIERSWASNSPDRNAEYERRFLEMADVDSKYARAIKNLVEGLGSKIGDEHKSITHTFDHISALDRWNERILTTGIILRYSYAKTFGTVFYKAFYPASPEFMRSFGKAFGNKKEKERWDSQEAARLISTGAISKEDALAVSGEVLARILWSIESNMKLAKELGIEREVRLLSDVSIAYPFHVLSELGIELDVEREVKLVKSRAAKLKRSN